MSTTLRLGHLLNSRTAPPTASRPTSTAGGGGTLRAVPSLLSTASASTTRDRPPQPRTSHPLDAVTLHRHPHGSGSPSTAPKHLAAPVNLLTQRQLRPHHHRSAGGGSYSSNRSSNSASLTPGPHRHNSTPDATPRRLHTRRKYTQTTRLRVLVTTKPGHTETHPRHQRPPPYTEPASYTANPLPSWGGTRGWFASIRTATRPPKTPPPIGYRRHTISSFSSSTTRNVRAQHITTRYEEHAAATQNPLPTPHYPMASKQTATHPLQLLGQPNRNQGRRLCQPQTHSTYAAHPPPIPLPRSPGRKSPGAASGTKCLLPSGAAAYTLTPHRRLRASFPPARLPLPTYVTYYSDPPTTHPNLTESAGATTPSRRDPPTAAFHPQRPAAAVYQGKGMPSTTPRPSSTTASPTPNPGSHPPSRTSTSRSRKPPSAHSPTNQQLSSATPPPRAPPHPPNFSPSTPLTVRPPRTPIPRTGHSTDQCHPVNVCPKKSNTALYLWDISLTRNTGHLRPISAHQPQQPGTRRSPVPRRRTIMAGAEFNWSSSDIVVTNIRRWSNPPERDVL